MHRHSWAPISSLSPRLLPRSQVAWRRREVQLREICGNLRNVFEVCLQIIVNHHGVQIWPLLWTRAMISCFVHCCAGFMWPPQWRRPTGADELSKALVIWSLEWQFVRFWFRIFIWVSEAWLWFNLVRCGQGVVLFCHSSLIHRHTCQERGLPLWRESLERALCWRSQGQPLVGSNLIHAGEVDP